MNTSTSELPTSANKTTVTTTVPVQVRFISRQAGIEKVRQSRAVDPLFCMLSSFDVRGCVDFEIDSAEVSIIHSSSRGSIYIWLS
jgi:hypothetical protein